jgi:hypothetical protein
LTRLGMIERWIAGEIERLGRFSLRQGLWYHGGMEGWRDKQVVLCTHETNTRTRAVGVVPKSWHDSASGGVGSFLLPWKQPSYFAL